MNLMLFFLFISWIHHSDLASPLIFNPHNLKIYISSSDSSKQNFKGPYAEACPLDTENKKEKKINKSFTLDAGKGLMVQRFSYSLATEPILWCEKGYELAAAFRTGGTKDVISFGYEIYFEYNELPVNLYNVNYEKYLPISYARSPWKQIEHKIRYYNAIDDHDSDDDGIERIWIHKVVMRYEISSWKFKDIRHTIHGNVSRQLKIECKDHDLGNTFYNKKPGSFNKFYSASNQKKIFAKVELPEGSGCESTHECVKKYDLLRPYHFEPYPGSPVSCPNLTTIPIWHEGVEELLNNLETFLFAIGQLAPNELHVLPGVLDVLSFPRKKSRKFNPKPMYLYPKRTRIPISRIIYKTVKYQTYNCDPQRTLCRFNVVIVIHNGPDFQKEKKLCPEDMCQKWGWERIKFSSISPKKGNGSERIYCCEWNKELRDMLGYGDSKSKGQPLNLYKFPIFDKKNYKTTYEDKKKNIQEQMEQLEKELKEEETL